MTAPYTQIEKGTLLVASPDIDSGLFFRAVILVCEHNENGSFGLVINKTLDLDLPEELTGNADIPNEKISIRAGGPVQTNQMMLLHTSDKISQQSIELCNDGVFLGGDLLFLQEVLGQEGGPFIHLCFGYSGWGAGQLEREFLDGGWFLAKGTRHQVFHTPPENLWRSLLKSMGGKYAMLSTIPEDLTVN